MSHAQLVPDLDGSPEASVYVVSCSLDLQGISVWQ